MNCRYILFFILIILCSSCSVGKRNHKILSAISDSQMIGINGLDMNEDVMSYIQYKLQKLHLQKLELFKKHNINIKDGYLYVMDQLGDSYSQSPIYGNMWSRHFNYYYQGNDSLVIVEDYEADDKWYLFKRAIEE